MLVILNLLRPEGCILISRFHMVALLIFLTSPAVSEAADFVGQVVVSDGDTIEMHGTRIRIWGVDAVESPQVCFDKVGKNVRCGSLAANALAGFIAHQTVSCTELSRDRYRRPVATCLVGGVDIGEWLVKSGWAIDYSKYSNGRYAEAQETARSAGLGNWAYAWQYPEKFRACLHTKGGKALKCSQQQL